MKRSLKKTAGFGGGYRRISQKSVFSDDFGLILDENRYTSTLAGSGYTFSGQTFFFFGFFLSPLSKIILILFFSRRNYFFYSFKAGARRNIGVAICASEGLSEGMFFSGETCIHSAPRVKS